MAGHRSLAVLSATLAGAALFSACGGDSEGPPADSVLPALPAPLQSCQPATISSTVLSLPNPLQNQVAGQYHTLGDQIVAGQSTAARQTLFFITGEILQAETAGLYAGNAVGRDQLEDLIKRSFCITSLPQPDLDLSDAGAVVIVTPTSPGLVIANAARTAAVQISTGAVTEPTLITITPISTTNPLATTLTQYGPFFEFGASPDNGFALDVLTGLCLDLPDDATRAQVRLAHNVPGGYTPLVTGNTTREGIEVMARVSTDPLTLSCASEPAALRVGMLDRIRSWLLPEQLYARARIGGIGGRVRKFSPFGGVQVPITTPLVELIVDALDTARANTLLGVAPQVRVKDATLAPLPGATVTASVSSGNGIITGGSTAVTDAQGIATFSALTLGNSGVGVNYVNIGFTSGTQPTVVSQEIAILCSETPLTLGQSLNAELRTGDCREPSGLYERWFAIDVSPAQEGAWRFATTATNDLPLVAQSGPADLGHWLGYAGSGPGTKYLHLFLRAGRNYLVAGSPATGPITVASVAWNGVVDCFAPGQVSGPRTSTLALTEALSNQYSCTFGTDQRYVFYQMMLQKNYQLQVRVTSQAFKPSIRLLKNDVEITSNTAATDVAEVIYINSTEDIAFMSWSVYNQPNPAPPAANPFVGNYSIEVTTTPIGPIIAPGLRLQARDGPAPHGFIGRPPPHP